MIVAIDGPAGSGKSSTAKEIAKQLGWIYLDTGAMYRSITFYFIKNNIIYKKGDCYDKVLENINLKIINEDSQSVFLNNEDVTSHIRSTEVTQFVSTISTIPEVRKFCVNLQREISKNSNVVIEGRDIGTKVFPNAEVKIFLTASVEERAKRRFNELNSSNNTTFEQLVDDIKQRDQKDTERKISPLKIAGDATVIDTSGMDFNQQITKIKKHIEDVLSI
jgi:CMP/dCMP kinase